MPNAFDSANYPTREPSVLVAGDRWAWKRTDLGSDYPPASYALRYSARIEGETAAEIEIDASESGDDYIVEVPAATTAGYTPGVYHWQAYIVRSADSERVTVSRGTFEVRTNRDATGDDPRSHAKKVLDAIEAVIEQRASVDQMAYSINGRTLSRTPIADLLVLRDRYREEVRAQNAAEGLAKGLGNPKHIGIRFNRV